MIIKYDTSLITLQKSNTKVSFLPTGDIFQILSSGVMVNQYLSNALDGAISGITMRIYDGDSVLAVPLIGKQSGSTFSYNTHQAKWQGSAYGVEYIVCFTLTEYDTWFFNIEVIANEKTVDFLYGQDLSLANPAGTLTNELYMSQYIDNKVLENDEYGFVLSARQNQVQDGNFPYLQQGSLGLKVTHYSTDAIQFFGKEYKQTNIPKALHKDLENRNYQFESSYTALQTEKVVVSGKIKTTFYALFQKNYPTSVNKIDFADTLKTAHESVNTLPDQPLTSLESIELKPCFGSPIFSEPFNTNELESYFPKRYLEEVEDGKLLSFFKEDNAHVVMMEKELAVERAHGHIIFSGVDTKKVNNNIFSSTNYMYGVFHSHIVMGNTSMHKLLSVSRGLLNNFKNSGQRVYIKLDGTYRLLTLPYAYELGANYSKWYYKIQNDILIITSYVCVDTALARLEVVSANKKEYSFIVTNQLVMGTHEFEQPLEMNHDGDKITFTMHEKLKEYPNLAYQMELQGSSFKVSDDSIFFSNGNSYNKTLLTLCLEPTKKFSISIKSKLTNLDFDNTICDFSTELEKSKQLFSQLNRGLHLSINGINTHEMQKINTLIYWYTHNAMVHFATPHGLEQPGGAAWGTRDVCQGPLEFFIATGNYELARDVLCSIYSHQFKESGEWPQWFMFDNYKMQQDDCHGDVVFWPIKILGDYLNVTGDYTILNEQLPYIESSEKTSVMSHLKLAINTLHYRKVNGTNLISYAGGDWDDTLQPANKQLKEKLVSAWTVALAYQSINQMADCMQQIDKDYANELAEKAENIKNDFNNLLIKDDVVAGFAHFGDTGEIKYLLHPTDEKTGITYRLLPMTRSILAEIVNYEQASKNLSTIEKNLLCPDGVRLMNRPARYKGGITEFFQRAEQAANVGREIGLQYVHAHIRYIETMAKVGEKVRAWEHLAQINPVLIGEKVPNAMLRQSNSYFSSSDGAFDTRYDFQENAHKLFTGDVKVKGGWRIYSSGPGILLNQLISNLLGIRFVNNNLVLDPCIPNWMDGVTVKFMIYDKEVLITYNTANINENKLIIGDKTIPHKIYNNRYKTSGMCFEKEDVLNALKTSNHFYVYVK